MSLIGVIAGAARRRGVDPAFSIRVKTDNTGTSGSNQFTLPLTTGTYDYTVDWGDGVVESYTSSANQTHTYSSAGTYDIRITGTFPRIFFNNAGDRQKLLAILNWGDVGFTSFQNAFFGCLNNSSLPDGSLTGAESVTDFSNCFRANSLTSIPSGLLDNTPNVTNFSNCFRANFLPTLPAGLFDNTPNVTDFSSCFQQIGLTSLPAGLFDNAPNVTNFSNCFFGNTINTTDYSNLLIQLEATSLQNNVTFQGGNSRYNASGQAARDTLTSAPRNWTITDGGLEI